MLEVVVAFIWLAISYIIYYAIDKESVKENSVKRFMIFTGFAVNSILCFAYAYTVETGTTSSLPAKTAFIINSIAYLYLFALSQIKTTAEELYESIRSVVKKLNY